MATFTVEQRKTLTKEKMAMPDGSYPIRNVSDLKNAISSYGRAKDKDATKAWIKKRAKELNAEDLIPESWKESISQSYTDSEYLIHYGVKGMKWGVRRQEKKAAKAEKRAAKKQAKQQLKSIKKDRRNAAKDRRLLSDEELNQRVRRLETEKRLKNLTDEDTTPGRTAVKRFLKRSGRKVADASVDTAIQIGKQSVSQVGTKQAVKKMTGR